MPQTKPQSDDVNAKIKTPEEINARMKSSEECFEDIKSHGLLKPNYTSWAPKGNGRMKGVTLFGTTKTGLPKRVYVKNYVEDYQGHKLADVKPKLDFNELNDYAVFTILKRCGARAPKVKLAATEKGPYLFSTDVAQKKNKVPQKNYWYFELSNLPYTFENGALIPVSDHPKVPLNKNIAIDKINLIQTILLAKIFNLSDLHGDNIGFLISDHNDRQKAKLACIDFLFFDALLHEERMSIGSYQSHHELLDASLKQMFDSLQNGHSIKNLITNEDYIAAFKKIDDRFINACDEVKDKIKDMTFESDERKNAIYQLINVWVKNFRSMQNMIHKIENEQGSKEIKSLDSDIESIMTLSPSSMRR